MTRKIWVVGAGLVLIAMISAAVTMLEKPTNAQANRQPVPLFEPAPLWSQALPNKWVSGQVGGLAVDSHDNLWAFHRPGTIPDGERAASLNPPQAECCIPAPAVLEFDTNGKFLQWLSGSSKEDNHILKFTNRGQFLMQIGCAREEHGQQRYRHASGGRPCPRFSFKDLVPEEGIEPYNADILNW
jgi:hypothetical protein